MKDGIRRGLGLTTTDAYKVCAGFVFGQSTVTPQWRWSYTRVLMRDQNGPKRIVGELAHESTGVHIPAARSNMVRSFLKNPHNPDLLWIHDTDATFPDWTLEAMIACMDPIERPIIGALAFGVRPERDAEGNDKPPNDVMANRLEQFPTIYTLNEDGSANIVWDYPRDTLMRCHSTGAHCLLIHRNVLEDPRWLEDGQPNPWFRTAVAGGKEVSEDQFFCIKAQSFGYPVHVHTGIKTGHVKTFVADESLYLAGRADGDD
jgi:hypothetical protein